jgi:hypothetical protein
VTRRRQALPSFIAGVCVALTLGLSACGSSGSQVSQSDRDRAVDAAQVAFRNFVATGAPLELGPCVSESLPGLPDWVVDIAHEPRQAVDDDPSNQCQRYRSGQAHHFVELDEHGQLLKAQ